MTKKNQMRWGTRPVSLGLTIHSLPEGSQARDIAETIQKVADLKECDFDTAVDVVRRHLLRHKIMVATTVWGEARAAARGSMVPPTSAPVKKTADKQKARHGVATPKKSAR